MPLVIERHDPGEGDRWREIRDGRQGVVTALLTRPLAGDTAALLLALHAELAAWNQLLGEPDATIRADLAAAAAWGAAAGVATLDAGAPACPTVRVAVGRRDYRFAASGHTGMHGQRWCLAFALAAITGAVEARRWLANPRVIAACQPPPTRADWFWEPLATAFAEVAERSPAYDALAAAATAITEATIAEPDYVTLTRRPLIALLALLRDGINADGWTLAVAAALEAHRRFYGGERRRDPAGFIAVEVLGLCAIARERGLVADVASPYLPLAWLDGDWWPVRLRLDYPDQVVADALESRWVIDRLGYPRSGREQHLGAGDHGLTITTGVPGTADLPPAELTFTELPPRAGGPGLRALDRDVTLAVAEALAAQGLGDEARAARRRALAAISDPDPERAELLAGSAGPNDMPAGPHTPPAVTPPAIPELAEARDIAAALVAAAAVKSVARPMLEALFVRDPAAALCDLQPRDEDYSRVFTGAAVAAAHAAFAPLWRSGPPLRAPEPAQTELTLWVAPAGMLASANELSRDFPNVYRALAPWLDPHHVWLAWRFARPGAFGGLSYDGLVWCDDHWAWFPHPGRILAELADRTP